MQPRRGRCRGCQRTQVLLPASVLLRRADAVTVIGAALLARAGGAGHRPIAVLVKVPCSMAGSMASALMRVASQAPIVRGCAESGSVTLVGARCRALRSAPVFRWLAHP